MELVILACGRFGLEGDLRGELEFGIVVYWGWLGVETISERPSKRGWITAAVMKLEKQHSAAHAFGQQNHLKTGNKKAGYGKWNMAYQKHSSLQNTQLQTR